MEEYEDIEKSFKEIEEEIVKTVDKLSGGNYVKIKDELIMTHMSESLINKIIELNKQINDNSDVEAFERRVTNEKVMQINDKLIYLLCDYYINRKDIDKLIEFTNSNDIYFNVLPQAKTAKLIKNIVEKISMKIRNISTLYVIFKRYLNWAYEKKRNFLRCRIEAKIIILFVLKQKYKTALSMIDRLLKEVRKVDDKTLLLELYIMETKIHMLLKNSTKMKASLTFAKNVANTINSPIYMNSEIDLLSGILFMYDKEFKSAYIFFYECYETLYTYIYNSRNNAMDFLSKKQNDFSSMVIHNIINTSTISSQNKTKNMSQISPFLLSFYTFYEYYDVEDSVLNMDEVNMNSTNPNFIYASTTYTTAEAIAKEHSGEKLYCITNPIEPNETLVRTLTLDNYGNVVESNRKDSNKEKVVSIPNPKNPGNIGLHMNIENVKLMIPLKYMLLCKILEENSRKEINNIICENNKINYIPNKEVQILIEISKCYENRSLDLFEKVIKGNMFLINVDKVIYNNLKDLYELLLEKNILKIIEAYSCIDLKYISEKLNLDVTKIISKLSEMILDEKIHATLDQNVGILIVYDDIADTKMHENVLDIIDNLTESVDILYEKAELTI